MSKADISYREIPLFSLNYDGSEKQALLEVLESKWISMGPRTERLESEFAAALEVPYAVAVNSCTAALHLAMVVAGIQPGDEVLVPSVTFVATANAVKYVGATPILCDIASISRPTICVEDVKRKLSERTKAIIPMHYAGYMCDMDGLQNIAHKHNLTIVEDACHAPLTRNQTGMAGSIGRFGCFSFFSNKNISSGEGGMIVCHTDDDRQKIKLYRSHGMTTSSYDRSRGHAFDYDVVGLGYNYRLDDIRAALVTCQLRKLPESIKRRKHLRSLYVELLSSLEDKVVIPFAKDSYESANYIMPVVLNNYSSNQRNAVRAKMKDCGIQTSVHYPAVHRFSAFLLEDAGFPNAASFVDSEVTLPLFDAMTDEDVHYVVQNLERALSNV